MSEPLVSVVVATYNMAAHLPNSVASVLGQTYRNLEVIIVDDGSTDHTSEVMAPFAREPRVRIVRQENLGQPRAKNEGVRRSRGDFVAFCDADDQWRPDKLSLQIPCFEKSDRIGVVYSDVEKRTKDGCRLEGAREPCYSGKVLDKLVIRNFVPFSTVVIRRSSLDEVGLFNESYPMGIDWDLWLRMALHYDFFFVDETTCTLLVWDGQMSRNYRGRYEWAFKILANFMSAHPAAIPKRLAAEAWADMYLGRGDSLRIHERARLRAFKDYYRALTYAPYYLPAWKSIMRLMLFR